MTEIDLAIPEHTTRERAAALVIQAARDLDLNITLTSTLASYPGSSHWHFKMPGQKGVLELTWSPNRQRLWFKIAQNRNAEWIEPAIIEISRTLEATPCKPEPSRDKGPIATP